MHKVDMLCTEKWDNTLLMSEHFLPQSHKVTKPHEERLSGPSCLGAFVARFNVITPINLLQL